MESTAIIVAAGVGRRMNSDVKKQYMEIDGHPVLFYTLRAFEASHIDNVIVVTGAEEIDYVRSQIVRKYNFEKVAAIIPGGKERYDSVFEGMKYLKESTTEEWQKKSIVLIHDGVRPLVSPRLINAVITSTLIYDACVTAVPVKDTIKSADKNGKILATLDRSSLKQIQTPQGFDFRLLYSAYEKMYASLQTGEDQDGEATEQALITDDASLIEKYTENEVVCVMGDYNNLKITTPEDVALAGFLFSAFSQFKKPAPKREDNSCSGEKG